MYSLTHACIHSVNPEAFAASAPSTWLGTGEARQATLRGVRCLVPEMGQGAASWRGGVLLARRGPKRSICAELGITRDEASFPNEISLPYLPTAPVLLPAPPSSCCLTWRGFGSLLLILLIAKEERSCRCPQMILLAPLVWFPTVVSFGLVSDSVLEKLLGPSSCFLLQVPRVLFLGRETNPFQANNAVIGILCRRWSGWAWPMECCV